MRSKRTRAVLNLYTDTRAMLTATKKVVVDIANIVKDESATLRTKRQAS